MNPPRTGWGWIRARYLAWRGRHGSQTLLAMRNRRQASERRRPSLILSAAAPLPTFSAATGPYHCRCHLDWGINQTSPCNVSLVEVRMRERRRYLQIRMAELISFSAGRRKRGRRMASPSRRRFEICIPFHSAGSFPRMTGNSPLAPSLSHFTVVQRFIFADIIFIVSHTCREQKEGRHKGAVATAGLPLCRKPRMRLNRRHDIF